MAKKRMMILEKTKQCLDCTTTLGASVNAGIAHYKKRHPYSPENCYQLFNATWDPNYDRLIKAFAIQLKRATDLDQRLRETIGKLESENKQRNILATKLNGIIMILQSKQEAA